MHIDVLGIIIIGIIFFLIPALLMLFALDFIRNRMTRKKRQAITKHFEKNNELLIYSRGNGIIGLFAIILIYNGYIAFSNNYIIFSIFSILLGSLLFARFFKLNKYVNKQPYLIMNYEGIISPTTGLIYWSDVGSIGFRNLSFGGPNRESLIIELLNRDKYFRRLSFWVRKLNKSNNIVINIGNLTVNPYEIQSNAWYFKSNNLTNISTWTK